MSRHTDSRATEVSGNDPLVTGPRMMLAGLRARMFGVRVPEQLGPFELLQPLGGGAHGDVYEAVDRQLQRHVALKLLRGSGHARTDEVLAQRLLREAKALARLSHPNVVEVFGAGIERGRVWIAMELVRGQTLRDWAQNNPVNSVADGRRALQLLVQAGRGLSAAHRAGIVHRDFKPANVLVGDDGRVRVADFGLARWDEARDAQTPESSERRAATDDERLTGTGNVLGTPRYMSPEQFAGAALDARSDQYNFAVAAWELLTGAPPFRRRSLAHLSATPALPPIPDPSFVPRSVFRVLRRGLCPDPAGRHRTMQDLVDALQPRPRRVAWVAGTVLVAASAGVFLAAPPNDAAAPRCHPDHARAELDPVWNAARKTEVQDGLRHAGVPYAERAVARVDAAVDAYAASWADQHVALCRGLWHDGTVDATQLDAGMRCLGDGLRTLDTLLARFDSATPELMERAELAVVSLPLPTDCSPDAERDAGPPVPSVLRRDLADAQAAALAGDDPTAEALAERVAAQARTANLARVEGDALEIAGKIGAVRRETAGYGQLQRAYEMAVADGEDPAAFRRAYRLARAAATLDRFEEADDYLRHAQTALARFSASSDDRTQMAIAQCRVRHDAQSAAVALPTCLEAARLAADPDVAAPTRREALGLVATMYRTLGRVDEAEASLQSLRRQTTQELGAEHPATARLVKELAYIAAQRNDADEAIARMSEYLVLMEAARGQADETLPLSYADLASFYNFTRRFDEAQAAFDEGLRILDAHAARDPTKARLERAQIRANYAIMLRTSGHADAAETMLRDALSDADTSLPEDHSLTISMRLALGATLLLKHEYDEANTQLGLTVAWTVNAKHPRQAEALLHQALALEGLGRWNEASAAHETVVQLVDQATAPQRAASIAHLAWIAARNGDVATAERHLASLSEPMGPYAPLVADLARAELKMHQGDRRGAIALAEQTAAALADPYPGAAQADTQWRANLRRACWLDATACDP